MDFSYFFSGAQADLLLMLLAPLACAMFRALFLWRYRTHAFTWPQLAACFRYGFWWGMDFNAYVFLILLLCVSLPTAIFPSVRPFADGLRCALVTAYLGILYLAFIGKMIFYDHFHDTFNATIRLGIHADKKNFADIFFHQHHGGLVLLGIPVYLAICVLAARALLMLPRLPYDMIAPPDGAARLACNVICFVGAIVLFYWLRYGGTLNHRKKPEWDEVPPRVKEDTLLAKAAMDDLIALELAWKKRVSDAERHTDDESWSYLTSILPEHCPRTDHPLSLFARSTAGPRVTPPSHIFFLLGESHAQAPLDPMYHRLGLMEASLRFRSSPHTVTMDHMLSAGMTSRPSLVSLFTGLYDSDMEINEMGAFWQRTFPNSLPQLLHRLGYRTEYWYGGYLNHGSMEHFVPAIGFDAWHAGPEICGEDAPQTWLGVYDHIFLEEAAARIEASTEDGPVFHFLYTTSNHGPYNMPYEKYGFDLSRVMRDAPEVAARIARDKKVSRRMASIWYADQALIRFAERMKKDFPDSLIIITGDHSFGALPYEYDVAKRREPTIREAVLTSFAMYHRELTPDMLPSRIGGHMNILPTLLELIAPQGFSYLSPFAPLTQPLSHVVTPYCWETEDTIGDFRSGEAQPLKITDGPLPTEHLVRFQEERDALCELTGWYVRHPELLEQR
ncbi:LTA synthase family protein [Selenomonas bovis]|uniref:LTA synthase family protein n=1 Tax=Selenomonas bovis TaxID=416586 RepID=UPI003CFBE0D6